jgi:hypothetical protein
MDESVKQEILTACAEHLAAEDAERAMLIQPAPAGAPVIRMPNGREVLLIDAEPQPVR